MLLDFHRTSKGKFAVWATVAGSYGEQVYSQVGRNYTSAEQAVAAAVKRYAAGQVDVALVVSEPGKSRRHIPLSEIAKSLNYERVRRMHHGPKAQPRSDAKVYPRGTFSAVVRS